MHGNSNIKLLFLYLTLVSGCEAGNWRREPSDVNSNKYFTVLSSLKFCEGAFNWLLSLKFLNVTLAKHIFIAYPNGKCFMC